MSEDRRVDLAIRRFLGKRVKSARLGHGLTREDLAARMGISLLALRHIERGETRMTWAGLAVVAKALRVSTADLVTARPYPLVRADSHIAGR